MTLVRPVLTANLAAPDIVLLVGPPTHANTPGDTGLQGTRAERGLRCRDDGEHMRLLRQKHNQGSDAATKRGLRHVKFDWVVITDANSTYPADALPELIAATDGCNMVVGARIGESVSF